MLRSVPVLGAALVAGVVVGAAAGTPASQSGCWAAAHPGGANTVCLGTIPPQKASLVLRRWGGSSEHGVAWIVFGLHETKVVIRLQGQPEGIAQPAILRSGRCGKGGPTYLLGNVVAGRRTARIDSLPHWSGYALEIRESSSSRALVACGVIPRRHD